METIQKKLQLIFWIPIVLSAIIIVSGELDIIPNGIVQPHSNAEFKLNTMVIILTVVGVPTSLKLFSLNTTKGLRRMNNDEALRSYHVWSTVRMAVLTADAILGFVAYYLSLNVTGLLCALVAMATTFYCWPVEHKISDYVDRQKMD